MAYSARLADIEEKFFECSYCLSAFKDPKLLPCVHRFCRDCLKEIIAEKRDSFHCLLCQHRCKVPDRGVDGFKTDSHVKNVVEFLQLEISFERDDVKKCHGCEEKKEVIAFCFKCKNFLCDRCYEFHLDNKMVAEHRPHVLNFKDVNVKGLTLDKLALLTEDPRCTIHVKHLAQLCCGTCGNIPICVACIFGDHEGHATREVKKLARTEREKVKAALTKLDKYKDNLYKLPKKVEDTRKTLRANVGEKLEKARSEHGRTSEQVSRKLEEVTGELEQRRREIRDRMENECNQVKQECDKEMEKVRNKYEGILKEKEQKYDKETQQVEEKLGQESNKLNKKLEELRKEFKTFEEKIDAEQLRTEQEIQGILDHSERMINRYENFTATSSTVLASNNEWMDAQCLPDITAASEVLIEEVKKDVTELVPLSDIKIGDLSLMFVDKVTITEHEESLVDIKGVKGRGWLVRGITSTRDGHIIITGWVSGGQYSHITVINKKGDTIRQDQIEKVAYGPYRFCESLSESLIATACQSNQVGIYDVRNGKYVKKDIKDININWPGAVLSVTTDTKNNIYVGSNGRDVLVFDNQLNYQHTIKLPKMIENSYDMTVHEDNLVVCDNSSRKAYQVTMEGQGAMLHFGFQKPNLDGGDWHPISVCTDSNSFIYMLWSGSGRMLTQYSQDGRQLLTTMRVENNAQCITILEADMEEKLLIATQWTAKLYTFGLNYHIID